MKNPVHNPFHRLLLPAVLLSALLPPAAQAQQAAPLAVEQGPILTGGTSLLKAGGLGSFAIAGDTKLATSSEVAVTGQPFQSALQLKISKKPDRDYAIRLNATTSAAVEKGDVIVATFWMRGVDTLDEGGEALSAWVFEQSEAPFNKSADVSLSAPLGAAWKRFQLPFAARESHEAGKTRCSSAWATPRRPSRSAGSRS